MDDLSESEVETLIVFLHALTDGEHRQGDVSGAGADLRSFDESNFVDPLAGLIGIFGQGEPANIAEHKDEYIAAAIVSSCARPSDLTEKRSSVTR